MILIKANEVYTVHIVLWYKNHTELSKNYRFTSIKIQASELTISTLLTWNPFVMSMVTDSTFSTWNKNYDFILLGIIESTR